MSLPSSSTMEQEHRSFNAGVLVTFVILPSSLTTNACVKPKSTHLLPARMTVTGPCSFSAQFYSFDIVVPNIGCRITVKQTKGDSFELWHQILPMLEKLNDYSDYSLPNFHGSLAHPTAVSLPCNCSSCCNSRSKELRSLERICLVISWSLGGCSVIKSLYRMRCERRKCGEC